MANLALIILRVRCCICLQDKGQILEKIFFGADKVEHTLYSTIFIMDKETQKERNLDLTNWDIPLRPGHEIRVFRIFKNKTNGYYLAIKNKNLDKVSYNPDGIKKVVSRYFFGMFLLALFLWFIAPMIWLFFFEENNFMKDLAGLISFSGIGLLIYNSFSWRSLYSKIKRRLDIELS